MTRSESWLVTTLLPIYNRFYLAEILTPPVRHLHPEICSPVAKFMRLEWSDAWLFHTLHKV